MLHANRWVYMKYLIYGVLLCCLASSSATAQKGLLRKFGSDTGYLFMRSVDPANKMVAFSKELNCSEAKHHYFLKEGQLYIQIDGSGKLFVWDSTGNEPRRLDATCYEGYNFGAYNFVRNKQFFSLGGWGFWQFNGGLRYYSEKLREWSVIQLNKEVPFSQWLNAYVYEDNREGLIYVTYLPYPNSYVQNTGSNVGDSMLVQCLDLKTNTWWEKPRLLNPDLANKTAAAFPPVILPGIGLIAPSKEYLCLFDFKHERVYKLGPELAEQVLNAYVKNKNGFYVVKDSSIHYYNPTTDLITSFRVSRADLIPTDKKLWLPLPEPFRPQLSWVIGIVAVLLLLVGSLTILYLRQQKRMRSLTGGTDLPHQKHNRELLIDKATPFSANLTGQEKAVLDLLLSRSLQGQPASIDEINRVLGVKNKDVAVQNKLRSDTLQMINKKFMVYTASQDTLVEREKTDFDKRVYQYRINGRYLNKVK